jgi:hypothetical protein
MTEFDGPEATFINRSPCPIFCGESEAASEDAYQTDS